MIVGKGLLAGAFEPHFGTDPDIVIFASGVSNSSETRPEAFERERALLQRSLGEGRKRLVYFSSCGVTAPRSEFNAYMQHKQSMESSVLRAPGGVVLRLPQVVGRTNNPHTLTNFLRDRIVSGEHFTVWMHAERNLIDVDDIVKIAVRLAPELPSGAAMTIAAGESSPMPRIVEIFEDVLQRTANCSFVEKGTPMVVDASLAQRVAAELGLDLSAGYAERVINKYYGLPLAAATRHSAVATDRNA